MLKFILFAILIAFVIAVEYCPSADDLVVTYTSPGGGPTRMNQGWQHRGGGGVGTKSSFNLLGGSVEYDIDFSGVHTGVNANIYSISPQFSSSYGPDNYCDGAKPAGSEWCVEVDWIESNGNCGGQSTLHTRPGPGSGPGCTAWGCGNGYTYNGQASFHMKITYDNNGAWHTSHNGVVINPTDLNPQPQAYDNQMVQTYYQQKGAVIVSTQWVGWVPGIGGCSTNPGDLPSSTFTVKNLRINGTVVQGPRPQSC